MDESRRSFIKTSLLSTLVALGGLITATNTRANRDDIQSITQQAASLPQLHAMQAVLVRHVCDQLALEVMAHESTIYEFFSHAAKMVEAGELDPQQADFWERVFDDWQSTSSPVSSLGDILGYLL